ncbi:MAG: hypothetical protein U5R48_12365 [Gammaproteobacteria bacterium]|nr:hypothetical protein [Gammaproteobacteria bacterium]
MIDNGDHVNGLITHGLKTLFGAPERFLVALPVRSRPAKRSGRRAAGMTGTDCITTVRQVPSSRCMRDSIGAVECPASNRCFRVCISSWHSGSINANTDRQRRHGVVPPKSTTGWIRYWNRPSMVR